jgi:hypothetical protein
LDWCIAAGAERIPSQNKAGKRLPPSLPLPPSILSVRIAVRFSNRTLLASLSLYALPYIQLSLSSAFTLRSISYNQLSLYSVSLSVPPFHPAFTLFSFHSAFISYNRLSLYSVSLSAPSFHPAFTLFSFHSAFISYNRLSLYSVSISALSLHRAFTIFGFQFIRLALIFSYPSFIHASIHCIHLSLFTSGFTLFSFHFVFRVFIQLSLYSVFTLRSFSLNSVLILFSFS